MNGLSHLRENRLLLKDTPCLNPTCVKIGGSQKLRKGSLKNTPARLNVDTSGVNEALEPGNAAVLCGRGVCHFELGSHQAGRLAAH